MPRDLELGRIYLPAEDRGRFGVGLGSVALITGDFNNDGRLDVAGVNPTSSEVSVSLGRGDTTLEDPLRFPAGPGAA